MLKKQSGFTIVELLIVIVVIAILASISIVSYTGIQARAAGTVLQSDLRNAATQLTLDYTYNGTYPSSTTTANEGKGLTQSSGTTYTYTSTSTSYCLMATSSKAGVPTYYISNTSGTVTQGTCAPSGPPAPTGVSGAWNGCGFAVSWSAVSGATSYVVQFSLSSTFSTIDENKTGVTGTSTNINHVGSGYIRVAAVGVSGQGAWSSSVAVSGSMVCGP